MTTLGSSSTSAQIKDVSSLSAATFVFPGITIDPMSVLMDTFDQQIAPTIPGPSPKDKALRIGIYRNVFFHYAAGALKSYPLNLNLYPENLFQIAHFIVKQFPEDHIF